MAEQNSETLLSAVQFREYVDQIAAKASWDGPGAILLMGPLEGYYGAALSRIAALEAELATAKQITESASRVILQDGGRWIEIDASADRHMSEKYCVIGWDGGYRRLTEYFPDIYAAFAYAKQMVDGQIAQEPIVETSPSAELAMLRERSARFVRLLDGLA